MRSTHPAKHAHATRPSDMAVQKFEVMIAIVSSPRARCCMPKDESHVATACSQPLAKKHSVQIASITTT